MTEKRFESFEEFWPYYVGEHKNKTNRQLHFIGTSIAGALVGYAVVRRKLWPLVAAPVVGYGFSWFGHFFVEKNPPATFRYPVWSFIGDAKMWSKILMGKMDAEIERLKNEEAVAPQREVHANGVAAE